MPMQKKILPFNLSRPRTGGMMTTVNKRRLVSKWQSQMMSEHLVASISSLDFALLLGIVQTLKVQKIY